MKIVLISPYLFKSMAIRILSAAIKKTTHTVFTIFFKEIRPHDMRNPTAKEYELLRDSIKQIKPDIVGISVNSTFFKQAKELSRIIKESNKDIFIIWGGIHPTVAPIHSLECADAVCLGEGVYPMLELIESYANSDMERVEKIDNIFVKKDEKVIKNPIRSLEHDIDNYPDQDWSDQNTFYIENDKIFKTLPRDLTNARSYYIMSSLGCPFSCHFCCNDALKSLYAGKGRYVRRRSVDRVIKELKKAKELFPELREIDIMDEVFTFDKKWLKEFMRKYKDEINIPFSCYAHVSMLDEEIIKILLEGRLASVTMGIQSGSEDIRRNVFNIKTYSNKDILKLARYLKDKEIIPCYDLILDNPFEEKRHRHESLDLLLSLPRPFDLHHHSLTFFPGVSLTKRAIDEGIIKNEFIECDEQKSMFRWTAELDITRKLRDLFWDMLFFMTRYPGIHKRLIKNFSRSKLLYRMPMIMYPLTLMQKLLNKITR